MELFKMAPDEHNAITYNFNEFCGGNASYSMQ